MTRFIVNVISTDDKSTEYRVPASQAATDELEAIVDRERLKETTYYITITDFAFAPPKGSVVRGVNY
jgi:hypothetical protein